MERELFGIHNYLYGIYIHNTYLKSNVQSNNIDATLDVEKLMVHVAKILKQIVNLISPASFSYLLK